MSRNKLIIASAGAGKTTYLIDKAFEIIDKRENVKILITTYTRSNAEQIRVKVKKRNFERSGNYNIPKDIVIQEWFTFLLREGVRPFKSLMDDSLKYKSIGLFPDFQYNINRYKSENKILEHYFVNYKIIPNSISKFVCKTNEKIDDEVINRLSSLYSYIFIDEVQDLAGYDLELIRELFKSPINILLVGDPRQVTYLTNQPKLNSPYKNGKIEQYIKDKCNTLSVELDKKTLRESHRNNSHICDFSSRLYPSMDISLPCTCLKCRIPKNYEGLYVIREIDVEKCKQKFIGENIGVLRWQKAVHPEKNYGDSKGLTYQRVFIYPTKTIIDYLKDGNLIKEVKNKKGIIEEKDAFDIAKFYVAVTRANTSVFIIYDYKDEEIFIKGIQKYTELKDN